MALKSLVGPEGSSREWPHGRPVAFVTGAARAAELSSRPPLEVPMLRSALAVMAATLIAGPALAAAAEPRDEGGVRAAENRWSGAFITGDAATLDALLAPDYVSVNPAGKARPKAEIIEVARAYAAKHPGEHGQPMAATSTIT